MTLTARQRRTIKAPLHSYYRKFLISLGWLAFALSLLGQFRLFGQEPPRLLLFVALAVVIIRLFVKYGALRFRVFLRLADHPIMQAMITIIVLFVITSSLTALFIYEFFAGARSSGYSDAVDGLLVFFFCCLTIGILYVNMTLGKRWLLRNDRSYNPGPQASAAAKLDQVTKVASLSMPLAYSGLSPRAMGDATPWDGIGLKADVFPDQRNYTLQRIRSYIDYMAVALMFGIIGADRIPTTWVLVGLVVLAAWHKTRLENRFKPLDVPGDLDPLRENEGLQRVEFREAEKDATDARVDAYLRPQYIIIPRALLSKPASYVRSIITHERAHVNRQDSLTSFLYSNISKLGPIIITFPFFLPVYGLLGWYANVPLWAVLPVFTYYAPLLYFYLARKNYFYRRELMADAEAAHQLGIEYKSFIFPAARRERYIKSKSSDGSDTHPTFIQRWGYLTGQISTPGKSIFWLCFLGSIAGLFAVFGLALNLTYDPQNDGTSEFHITNVPVAFAVFSVWALNYLRILRFICEARPNGMSITDRVYGLGGFLLGAIVFCFFTILLFGPPSECQNCGVLSLLLLNIGLFMFFVLVFCMLQFVASWFDDVGMLGTLVPFIVLIAATNNMFHYSDVPDIDAGQTDQMLRDSISFAFLLFAYSIVLDIVMSATRMMFRRFRKIG